jgi:predicted RNA binding protein YcfA (HicA-like mRNA interferase family)
MTGKELVKRLQKEGFTRVRIHGSPHILKRGDVEVSVPVHAGKELGKGLERAVMKEAGLI